MIEKSDANFAGAGADLMRSLFDPIAFEKTYQACFGVLPVGQDSFATYLDCASTKHILPNSWFDELEYRKKYRDVEKAIQRGDFLSGFQHWCAHGCAEGRDPLMPVLLPQLLPGSLLDSVKKNFDQAGYERQSGMRFESVGDAIHHFLSLGAANGVNPFPPTFYDEDFYCLYYRDVQEAIEQKKIPCGLFHFLVRGYAEGRSGSNDKPALIRKKLGAAGQVSSITNISNLDKKLIELDVVVDRRCRPRVNLFLPSLDGDIMFGGYTAFLHFARKLALHGCRIRFLVTEDNYLSKDWCVQTLPNGDFKELVKTSEFENLTSRDVLLRCSPADINIAYSTWSAIVANKVAQHLDRKHIISFIQEYEPIFHAYSSNHFLSNAAYSLPQIAVFNSDALYRYFRKNRVGNFVDGVNSIFFEHSMIVAPPSVQTMLDPGRRRGLLCYARPEAHAARNLFEVVILSVRKAIERGYIDRSWNILGVGSLQDIDAIDLGGGCSMNIKSKLSLEDYTRLLQEYDVGLSLMWAPHPSVVPFEMAASGIVSVTNTFVNRPASWFKRFGANVVPVNPTLEGIVAGIGVAVTRAGNYEQRLRSAAAVKTKSWDEVFGGEFVGKVLTMFDRYRAP